MTTKSKLEADLYGQLKLMTKRAVDPWPEPVPQYRPLWCCQHRKAEHWHDALGALCWACFGVPVNDYEAWRHEFVRERNWSVDFAFPALKIAVECEGLGWRIEGGGRHTRPAGADRDLEKYATLEARGWRVLRASQRQISSGLILSAIEAAILERSVTA